jgi:hypothetical protein
MSIALFTILITILSSVSALLTQAVKKAYDNAGKKYSSNTLALINAIVVGWCGTAVAYLLLGIAFTTTNIVCLFLMGVVVWIGSMIGYDKIKQLIEQLSLIK